MATWLEDIISAFENLGGVCRYKELYEEVKDIREDPLPESWKAVIRGSIENHSSDSDAYSGGEDIFYSVKGKGSGVWGLRDFEEESSIYATDISNPPDTVREETTVYRVLRDTNLSSSLKKLHNNRCQICGKRLSLGENDYYSEAHHIKPLGEPHNGPDIAENIIVLCPNHHIQCDYGAIKLDINNINTIEEHKIGSKFIEYHNNKIFDES